MAYTGDNLGLWYQGVGDTIPRTFVYLNATPDTDGDIVTASYFSDGVAKGMQVGDVVEAINNGTGAAKYMRYQVTDITGTAVTVAQVTAIT